MSSRRQLAAILFSDIEGYTAMMQRSEEQAVLTATHYRQVLEDLVSHHQGEVSQDYGDGSLSLFKSAVEAVTCGIALQRTFRRPPYVPLRIGIHLGEILLEDGKAFGDSVNIASRIESLARAGSVLLSEKIVEEIKNKEGFRVKPLGSFQFKNVFYPTKVYALVDDALYVPERHELTGKVENKQHAYDLPAYPNVFVGRLRPFSEACRNDYGLLVK